MASSGCIRVVFIVFNVLFWIIGLGTTGYGAWILLTNDISLFLSGSLIFTYSFLGVGVFITVTENECLICGEKFPTKDGRKRHLHPHAAKPHMCSSCNKSFLRKDEFRAHIRSHEVMDKGLFGCLGGCVESTCILKTYVSLMALLLFVDVGVIVAGCVQKEMSFYVMDELWHDLNLDTKEHIQKQLGCCAYTNSTEEYDTDIPGSCYSNGILTNTTCEDAMRAWVEGNIPIWASFLGFIGLIQIVSFVLSCCVLKKIERLMRVGDQEPIALPERTSVRGHGIIKKSYLK